MQTEQKLQTVSLEEYEEKIERAKKLYVLFNQATFGDETESIKARCVLKNFNIN